MALNSWSLPLDHWDCRLVSTHLALVSYLQFRKLSVDLCETVHIDRCTHTCVIWGWWVWSRWGPACALLFFEREAFKPQVSCNVWLSGWWVPSRWSQYMLGCSKVPVSCHTCKHQQCRVPLMDDGHQCACIFKMKIYFHLILNVVR